MASGFRCSPCECGGHDSCTICNPPSVLTEAAGIVHGDRQAAYGHPADNHARTAEFWNTYLNWRRRIHGDDYQLDAYDVCHLNDLQKTSRDIHSRQRDNLVDKVGFVANAEMVDGGT